MSKSVYLAIPYSVWDMEKSFDIANRVSAELMKKGYVVFSPISHSHPIQKQLSDKHHTHDFWMKQDIPILDKMDMLVLVNIQSYNGDMVDGHDLLQKSVGCKEELMRATLTGKTIDIYNFNS